MMISGFRGFLAVWLGQFVSIFGSALTRFALTIWIYQETGSATALPAPVTTNLYWAVSNPF